MSFHSSLARSIVLCKLKFKFDYPSNHFSRAWTTPFVNCKMIGNISHGSLDRSLVERPSAFWQFKCQPFEFPQPFLFLTSLYKLQNSCFYFSSSFFCVVSLACIDSCVPNPCPFVLIHLHNRGCFFCINCPRYAYCLMKLHIRDSRTIVELCGA